MKKETYRKKLKDNPYNRKIVNNDYYIQFNGNEVKVSKEVYDLFDEYELIDIKQINEKRRHINDIDIDDYHLYNEILNHDKLPDEIVEDNLEYNNLKEAINQLPFFQKKRVVKYFFEEMTLKQIAAEEGCSIVAVKYSIDCALKNLLKKLTK